GARVERPLEPWGARGRTPVPGCLFVSVDDFDQRRLAPRRPKTCKPTGKVSRTNPIGTVIAGKPVGGESRGLLLPCGVLRSPIIRGGNAHVGKTSASSLWSSITFCTDSRMRFMFSATCAQRGF